MPNVIVPGPQLWKGGLYVFAAGVVTGLGICLYFRSWFA